MTKITQQGALGLRPSNCDGRGTDGPGDGHNRHRLAVQPGLEYRRPQPTAHFGLVDALTGAMVSGFPASGGGSEV